VRCVKFGLFVGRRDIAISRIPHNIVLAGSKCSVKVKCVLLSGFEANTSGGNTKSALANDPVRVTNSRLGCEVSHSKVVRH
jgi:hypothetical protein